MRLARVVNLSEPNPVVVKMMIPDVVTPQAIRALRVKTGLSFDEVADVMGCNPVTVRSWEKATVRNSNLVWYAYQAVIIMRAIAVFALGMETYDFLDLVDISAIFGTFV